MKTNRSLICLLILVILIIGSLTACVPSTSKVVEMYASEYVGTGLDGEPVIFEYFYVKLETCHIGSTEDGVPPICTISDAQMITREQFNNNTVGEIWKP